MNKMLATRVKQESFRSRLVGILLKNELTKRSAKHKESRPTPVAVFGNDWVGININVDGVYEGEHLSDLVNLLRTIKINLGESSAIDIGANIGNHSIEFARHFRRVYSFEPNPRTFDILAANTKRLTNVRVHNWGCASSVETIRFFEDFGNIGGSSSAPDMAAGNELEVQVKPLDDLLEELGSVELIKIDVEGMECSALKGAEKVISRFHPVICLEQHETAFTPDFTETESLDWLRSRGYRMFSLKRAKRKNLIVRRLANIRQLFFGIKEARDIVEYERLSRSTYPMIYAVHHSAL